VIIITIKQRVKY